MIFKILKEQKNIISLTTNHSAATSPGSKTPPKSQKNYVISFTERSGSTMLRSLLQKTGALGNPQEYINPRGPIQHFLSRYPGTDIHSYFDSITRYFSTPNGVFGMKTNYHDFKPVLEKSLIGKLLNPVKFIYLERRDVVLQAISSFIARQSGKWHSSNQSKTKEIVFDEKEILQLVDRILEERLEWEKFFTLYDINPLRILYEDLVSRPEVIVGEIFNFMDIPTDNKIDLQKPETKKLANDRNKDWAKKIRSKYTL